MERADRVASLPGPAWAEGAAEEIGGKLTPLMTRPGPGVQRTNVPLVLGPSALR